ncbi:hypothetical protein D3C84_334440 [compost metagenome]
MRAFEHRVVAEQVGVNVRPRQCQDFFFLPGDFFQRPLQQVFLFGTEVRQKLRALFQHPVQAAIGFALDHVGLGRQVQMAEQLTHLRAMLRVGLLDVLAGQARLQQRRFARQFAQGHAVCGAQGVRHRQVGAVQYVEQFNEEWHLLNRTALDQGQDKFALLQADKEIGVFATGGNPLEIKQAAEAIRGEKSFQLGPSQGGEHRHV